jgi:hypothetical protein
MPREALVIAAACDNHLSPGNAGFSQSIENECNPHLSFEQSGERQPSRRKPSRAYLNDAAEHSPAISRQG